MWGDGVDIGDNGCGTAAYYEYTGYCYAECYYYDVDDHDDDDVADDGYYYADDFHKGCYGYAGCDNDNVASGGYVYATCVVIVVDVVDTACVYDDDTGYYDKCYCTADYDNTYSFSLTLLVILVMRWIAFMSAMMVLVMSMVIAIMVMLILSVFIVSLVRVVIVMAMVIMAILITGDDDHVADVTDYECDHRIHTQYQQHQQQ